MIRPAKFADTPAIEKLLRSTHQRSKYAGRAAMNDKALNALVVGLIAGQNQRGPHASQVQVCERDGKVVGFMAGSLQRVYGILDKLVATDVFLINESNNAADTMRMIDGYIEWARSNRQVIEVGLSWSDAIKNSSVLARTYQRKGCKLIGETWELRLDVEEEREVA